MKRLALTLVAASTLALTACGGGLSEAADVAPTLRGSDYYALCDTYSGEVGNAVSDDFRSLTSSQRDQIHDIVADDPRCQPED